MAGCSRREFLGLAVSGLVLPLIDFELEAEGPSYGLLQSVARKDKWAGLSLGDRIARAGREFLGVPYVGSTLESNPERCQVFLDKLDCVTYLETSWAVARCAPEITEARVRQAVTQTRYRAEKVDGYWSRLHYTTDTLTTHKKAGKIEIVSEKFAGGVDWNPETSYMSTHAANYGASSYVKNFAAGAKAMEEKLADVRFKRIPVEKWGSVSGLMQAGDFLAFCTTKKGLDFSHVAIYSGEGRFMHASSSAGKVVEQDLLGWGKSVKSCNGMVVARVNAFPLD